MKRRAVVLSCLLMLQFVVAASTDTILSPWKVKHHYWNKYGKYSMTLTAETEKGGERITSIVLRIPSRTLIVPKCAYQDIKVPLLTTIVVEDAAGGGIIIAIDAIPVGDSYPDSIKHVEFLFSVQNYRYIQRIIVEGEKGKEMKYGQEPCGT